MDGSLTFFINVLSETWNTFFVGFEFFGTNMAEFLIALLIFGVVIYLFLYVANPSRVINQGISRISKSSKSSKGK